MIGKLLGGRYQILRELAPGGMSQTYLSEDTQMGVIRPLCVIKQLKLIEPNLFPKLKSLFDREAQTLHELGRHDQIPRLLAFFDEDREFYLVQEYIEGHTLSNEILPSQSWSESQVQQLLEELLEILVFVHRQGVIHRDIKPSNIIRRQHDHKLVLIDFGAVKQVQVTEINREVSTTVVIGTPGYMPPEQQRGKPRPNSDLYALGMLGIEALTGISPTQLLEDEEGEVVWCDRVKVSKQLAEFLTKMTRFHFKERYQTAEEALKALQQFTNLKTPNLTLQQVENQSLKQTVIIPPTPNNKRKKKLLPIGIIISLSFFMLGGLYTIFKWRNYEAEKQVLYQAENFHNSQKFQDCITEADKVSQKYQDLYERARELKNQCQLAFDRQLWNNAQTSAYRSNHLEAINKAGQISELDPGLYQKAQNLIDELNTNEKYLEEARKAVNESQLDDIKNKILQITLLGKLIEPNTDYYQQKIKPTLDVIEEKRQDYIQTKKVILLTLNEWMQARQFVYGSYYEIQYAEKFTTGEKYDEVIKTVEKLKKENSFYTYGGQKIDNVAYLDIYEDRATIKLTKTQELTHYVNEEVVLEDTGTFTETVKFDMLFRDGRWKIANEE